MIISGRFCMRSFLFVPRVFLNSSRIRTNTPEMDPSQWQMRDGRGCYDILRSFGRFLGSDPHVGRHVTMCVTVKFPHCVSLAPESWLDLLLSNVGILRTVCQGRRTQPAAQPPAQIFTVCKYEGDWARQWLGRWHHGC